MILKTLATACLALLLAVAPASAQVLGAQNVTAESTGACNAGACAAFDVPASAPSVTLQVSGTFSGTLTFEATSDNITWFTVMLVKLGDGASATTTTATGQFSLANSGVVRVRARATSLASGTARVTATRGGALARWLAPYFTTVTAADALILGAATTSGIRLDLESGTLAVREGDDSDYGPITFGAATARGHLLFSADNTYDIGASGATRPRNAYIAGFVVVPKVYVGTVGAAAELTAPADGVMMMRNAGSSDFSRLQFGGTTSSFPALKRSGTQIQARLADDSGGANFQAGLIQPTLAWITPGSGTGITLIENGQLNRVIYKVTIAKEQFITNGTTHDVTIATLPAKTALQGIYADVTQVFALGGAQLSMTVGTSAGGNQLLVSFDVDAATIQRGMADADLGTSINRANAVQGGTIFSWASTQIISLRLTSDSTNLGTGSATSLTTGSITLYLVTERMP